MSPTIKSFAFGSWSKEYKINSKKIPQHISRNEITLKTISNRLQIPILSSFYLIFPWIIDLLK